MALWQLLILVCFVVPVGSSLAAARHANVGMVGYGLAAIAGLVVGGFCAWTMWLVHKFAVVNIRQHPPSRQAWYFRALYVSKILWIALAGFLGPWLSLKLLWLISARR